MKHLELLIQSARRALFFREFGRARTLLEQALPYAEQQGVESFVYRALGDALCGDGEFGEAVASYRRAVATRPAELDPDSDDHASLLSNLGYALDQERRFDESEELHTQALAIKTRLHGKGHPALIQPLTNLAFGFLERGDRARAEGCLAESVRIAERAFGESHPAMAQPLNNLGELFRRAGELDAAAPLLQRALAIMEASVPEPDHPDLVAFLENNAALLRQQGHDDQASVLSERAERIRRSG
jgi:tetratricopeptide (TPR) repeat protein